MTKESEQLLNQDLPTLNESLKAKGQQPISPPPAKIGVNDDAHGYGGVTGASAVLPADFRLSY